MSVAILHPYILCEHRPGLRDSEVQVTVYDVTGRPERLRVERGFLLVQAAKAYLPVGIVAQHPTDDKVLIEFPHEADSGANRIWVSPDSLLREPPDYTESMSAEQIRRAGLAALRERLGEAGMVRFLQQFETGSGDYATERHAWVDATSLDDIRRAAAETGEVDS